MIGECKCTRKPRVHLVKDTFAHEPASKTNERTSEQAFPQHAWHSHSHVHPQPHPHMYAHTHTHTLSLSHTHTHTHTHTLHKAGTHHMLNAVHLRGDVELLCGRVLCDSDAVFVQLPRLLKVRANVVLILHIHANKHTAVSQGKQASNSKQSKGRQQNSTKHMHARGLML